jgi:hypothetical protein
MSRSTNSTEAEERLPVAPSNRHEALERAGRKVERRIKRLEHAIAAGVGDPVADRAKLESVRGEGVSTSPPVCSRTMSGIAG